MHTISVFRPIAAPASQVWAALRDFDSLGRWHPNVAASRLDRPQAVGCVRTLDLRNGAVIHERLERLDEIGRCYSYAVVGGPLPVHGYVGTLRVHAEHGACTVEWTATMTITADDPAPVAEALRVVYADGLRGLDSLFSGRPA